MKGPVTILLVIVAMLAIGAKIVVPKFLGDWTKYRYELTLSVSTPDGLKSASSVVEITSEVSGSFWHAGAADHVRGEALYLDLGPGSRPIVALIQRPTELRVKRPDTRWGEVSPTGLLMRLMHIMRKRNFDYQTDLIDMVCQMKSITAVFEVDPKDLPDLVTFADIANPDSVMAVDGEHLDATLGAGIAWQSITIQIVNEPLTKGLEKRLPWLRSIHGPENLDGTTVHPYANKNLANKLQRANFVFPD